MPSNEVFQNDDGGYLHDKQKFQPNGATTDLALKPVNQNTYINYDEEKAEKDKEIIIEDDDPWKVNVIEHTYIPWSDLDTRGKVKRVVTYFVKICLVLGFLYLFICSLDFLSSAFKLLGGKTAGEIFQENDVFTNPVAGLMIGVLVTVLVQSSSTSTSIIVSMVGAEILEIKTAIPMIMGANIGTSVTNTIVAVGQIGDKDEFRRAFAGATVHDMFNWLTVIILLPIEVATKFLFRLSEALVDSMDLETDEDAKKDFLKKITKPFTEKIVLVNKNAITDLAKEKKAPLKMDRRVLKVCCDKNPPKPLDCCDDYEFTAAGLNYTYSEKTTVCKELRGCVLRDTTADPPEQCYSHPWEYVSNSKSATVATMNCAQFNGDVSEQGCCSGILDAYSTDVANLRDVSCAQACPEISTCFTSTTSTFTNRSCLDSCSVKDVSATYRSEQFDCVKWVRDVENKTCNDECDYLFKGLYPEWSDEAIGALLLVISLFLLCVCLIAIVKLMHSIMRGPMAMLIKKFVNADFPGAAAYFTGYLAILIGAGLTILVQSSSIFTSTMTPLVGIGVIELDRMYPLTLGSNIGTTTTAILSALASSSGKIKNAMQVALCHLFFNICGILIFFPIPFLRFPIPMAKFLGNRTAKYRWFAPVYIILMFFLAPAVVFGLSVAGWYVLLAVGGPILLIVIIVCIIKVFQHKKPGCLPRKLQNWKFLPLALRSLEPYDRAMRKMFFCKKFQNKD